MAIRLQSKENVQAPGGNYPYGNIKDDDGSGNGTPVNVQVYADFHQFFAKLLADASIVGNDLPENSANTFQYILALKAIIDAKVLVETTARSTAVSNEATTRGSADTTLQNNINSEASTRGSADTTLQSNITSEAATRLAADNALVDTNVAWIAASGLSYSGSSWASSTGFYKKTGRGTVKITGLFTRTGTPVGLDLIATMPVGYRPGKIFVAVCGSQSTYTQSHFRIECRTDGTVYIDGDGGTYQTSINLDLEFEV